MNQITVLVILSIAGFHFLIDNKICVLYIMKTSCGGKSKMKQKTAKKSACTKIKNVKKNCTFPCRKVKRTKQTKKGKYCKSIFSRKHTLINAKNGKVVYRGRKKNKTKRKLPLPKIKILESVSNTENDDSTESSETPKTTSPGMIQTISEYLGTTSNKQENESENSPATESAATESAATESPSAESTQPNVEQKN